MKFVYLVMLSLVLVACGAARQSRSNDKNTETEDNKDQKPDPQKTNENPGECKLEDMTLGPFTDFFGASVSLSRDLALVGQPQFLNEGVRIGRSTLFKFENCKWSKVKDFNMQVPYVGVSTGGEFGRSVSISENIAVVGAPFVGAFTGSGSSVVTHYSSGAAFVYEKNYSGEWELVNEVRASPSSGDHFGSTVLVSGSRVFVGMPGLKIYDENEGGVKIFERSNGWAPVASIIPDAGSGGTHEFGTSLAVSGDRLFVGAPTESAIPPELPQVIGNAVYQSGRVYIFERQVDNSWMKVRTIMAQDPVTSAKFGSSIAVSENLLLVGAPGDDDKGAQSGSVYVFERQNDNSWKQIQKLNGPDATPNTFFGATVVFNGSTALISARDPSKDFLSDSASPRSVYFLSLQGGQWTQTKVVEQKDPKDVLGSGLAIYSNVFAIGARGINSVKIGPIK